MALLTALSVIVAGALAGRAQGVPDVGELGLDTPYTPAPKEAPETLWKRVAGAEYLGPDAEPQFVPPDSPTPFEADFFDVASQGTDRARAVGSREEDGVRVTAIYRNDEDEGWHEELRGPERGYVGAVTWLGEGRALAVGGDGSYPRRERLDGFAPCERTPDEDQAGAARVWLYEGGVWRELADDELPSGMHGLTAVAEAPDAALEFAIAGGLCELWHWRDGAFLHTDDGGFATPHTPQSVAGGAAWRYRVRAITFGDELKAFAVTSGCCQPDPAADLEAGPALVTYQPPADPQLDRGRGSWQAKAVGAVHRLVSQNEATSVTRRAVPDSFVSVLARGQFVGSAIASPGGESSDPTLDPASSIVRSPASSLSLGGTLEPEGYNVSSVRLADGEGDVGGSTYLLFEGGGIGNGFNSPVWIPPAARDLAPNSYQTSQPVPGWDVGGTRPAGPDGVPDWAVGELGTTGQAVVFATDATQLDGPDTALRDMPPLRECMFAAGAAPYTACLTAGRAGDVVGWAPRYASDPTSPELIKGALGAYKLMTLPAYALNAIDVVDDGSKGWAVGDHGAILRLTVNRDALEAASDPQAPLLGEPRQGKLPDDGPYDAFRPLSAGGDALVPPLTAMPEEELAAPRLEPTGSPDPADMRDGQREDVREIVMSRSGSEGWAIGPGPTPGQNPTLSMFHFDGERWRACEAPDPMCAALADLKAARVQLVGAARVPLERDDIDDNDDEFEVVAVGSNHPPKPGAQPEPVILRYRHGRWDLEDPAAREAITSATNTSSLYDVAFTAPDDGWILGQRGTDTLGRKLFHFDSKQWHDCERPAAPQVIEVAAECGDTDGRLTITWQNAPTIGTIDHLTIARHLVAAGDRLYLFGNRVTLEGKQYPLIVSHEDGKWEGAYDPAFGKIAAGEPRPPSSEPEGDVKSLAVARRPDGRYEGWALGKFGTAAIRPLSLNPVELIEPTTSMLALPAGGKWRPVRVEGPLGDALTDSKQDLSPVRQLVLPGDGAVSRALVAWDGESGNVFELDTAASDPAGGVAAWRAIPSARPAHWVNSAQPSGAISAFAPAADGDAWVSLRNEGGRMNYFYRYTDRPHRQVFDEVPHPFLDRDVTALAAARDGSVWAATNTDVLYRYDRVTGWDSVKVPGWDRGRFITAPSRVNAIAVDADGFGLAVGRRGRIAELEPAGARLDAAASQICGLEGVTACGTTHDLRAVAVAPGGAAIAGGDDGALIWRPAGGEFQRLPTPRAARGVTFTGAAMPQPDRAWLTTSSGLVLAGQLAGAGWQWWSEAEDTRGLAAIAVDGGGRGYAVGENGLVLERTGAGDTPWRHVDMAFRDDLTAVTLPVGAAGGGEGPPAALIGGRNGLILTLVDGGFRVARAADYDDGRRHGELTGPVAGLALLPGVAAGQIEAWAALAPPAKGRRASRILHYTTEASEPLLAGAPLLTPLPDAPEPRADELVFAAFGKTDCHVPTVITCPAHGATTMNYDVLPARIVDEIAARSQAPGGPAFTVFAGDAVDSAGEPASPAVEQAFRDQPQAGTALQISTDGTHSNGPYKLRRWLETFAAPLDRAGVPLFGAIGGQDLSEGMVCNINVVSGGCNSTRQAAEAGDNIAWRQAMAARPEPWGDGSRVQHGTIEFEALPASPGSIRHRDRNAPDPDGSGPHRPARVPLGGGSTHYGVRLVDGEREQPELARVLVVDSSLRSLSDNDPIQQPFEAAGQLAWLERNVCFEGTGPGCTRKPWEKAIVVSNTPTYTFGPAVAETALDAAVLEAVLMRHRASVIVSGRLGWNGVYWATAPGVHQPCPGGEQPAGPPEPDRGPCDADVGAAGDVPAADELASALTGIAPPVAAAGLDDASRAADGVTGLLPGVVASGGGGKLAGEEAPAGFWNGYSLVRLDASGDPRATVVEQRPIYDWITIDAQTHVLRPGQKLTLRGYGRGPLAVEDVGGADGGHVEARFDRIDSPAVTHRYDLLAADEQNPALPHRNADGEYVPLDPRVATVDRQTGVVKAGRGRQSRTYAVASLSVGDKAASYPLVFEPAKSFRPKAAEVSTLRGVASRLPAPTPQRPIHILPTTPTQNPSSPPPQPPVESPTIGNLEFPPMPPFPAVLPLAAATPITPPAPPSPPPPPTTGEALPLSLQAPISAVSIVPTVIPPTPPPINPAPPGGSAARKEARQRQAATAKSEEGAGSGAENARGDMLADSPHSPDQAMTRRADANEQAYTRRAQQRPVASFSAIERADQPSAWTRGLLYGGGLTLMAFALAASWTTIRPSPRRRLPETPAPAWNNSLKRKH